LTLLANGGFEIEGVRFWGTTFVSHAFSFLNELKGNTEDLENKIYSQIPSDTDVIITHNVPKGILDFATPDGYSVGSVALLDKVNAIKPKLHIFGHVHYQYGIKKTNNTVFYKCIPGK
jgi:Icc-related predicted phosphoesterase